MSIDNETVRNSDNEEPIKQNLHPGVVPVEEGGERPPEGAKPLTSNIEPTVDAFPDNVASLANPTDPQEPAHEALESSSETHSVRKPTPRQMVASGILAAMAGAGIFVGLTHSHDSENSSVKPVAASTPTPGNTTTPSASSTETTTPTVTPTPSATETDSSSETVFPKFFGNTEGVIPLKSLQEFTKSNQSLKRQIIANNPAAENFMDRQRIEIDIEDGVLTETNINNYLHTLKEVTDEDAFAKLFGTLDSTDAESYKALVEASSDELPSNITTLGDQLQFKAVAGSQNLGDKYWNLLSLNKLDRRDYKQQVEQYQAEGVDQDGQINLDDFHALDAFNVPMGKGKNATVILTYKKYGPTRSGKYDEHLDWVVLSYMPAGVIKDGSGDPNTGKVTGLLFDRMKLTNPS